MKNWRHMMIDHRILGLKNLGWRTGRGTHGWILSFRSWKSVDALPVMQSCSGNSSDRAASIVIFPLQVVFECQSSAVINN